MNRRGRPRGCHRRNAHHQARTGGVVRQESQSASEGPDQSPKAATAAKAWKARKA